MPIQNIIMDLRFFFEMNELVVVRTLLFLLILTMIFLSLSRIKMFKENRPVIVILSLAISIISVYYIGEDIIQNYILSAYQNLGIFILMIIPLMIVFFLIYKSGLTSSLRKGLWGIVLIIFIMLALATEIQDNIAIYGYLIGAGISLALIIFDKQIKKSFAE